MNDENIEQFDRVALISISDTSGLWSGHYFSFEHDNVINFDFDDVSNRLEKSPINKNECYPMTEDDEVKNFNFIKKHSGRNFIIHCAAGISRSGAVGQFITDYLELDQMDFRQKNPNILPNGHISRLLNKLAWNE